MVLDILESPHILLAEKLHHTWFDLNENKALSSRSPLREALATSIPAVTPNTSWKLPNENVNEAMAAQEPVVSVYFSNGRKNSSTFYLSFLLD